MENPKFDRVTVWGPAVFGVAADPASHFGGFKESGFGREGGMQGLRAYVRL